MSTRYFHELCSHEQDRSVSWHVSDILLDIVHGNDLDLCEHHKDLADKIASFVLTPEEKKKHDHDFISARMDEVMEDDEVIGNHGTIGDWVIDQAVERAGRTLYHSNDTIVLFDSDIEVSDEDHADNDEEKVVDSKDKKTKELN
jgi:hypothetical protein